MARKTLNASRLQQEVSRRIQRVQEVVDDGVLIGVPRPQLQPPDASGCNWTMKHFGNAAGFEAPIADVLAQVRAEYNLAGDDAAEAAAPLSGEKMQNDPFAGSSRPRAAAANPFGEAKPRERVNPFGEAGPANAAGPLASPATEGGAAAPQKKRPPNPFTAD